MTENLQVVSIQVGDESFASESGKDSGKGTSPTIDIGKKNFGGGIGVVKRGAEGCVKWYSYSKGEFTY